MGGRVALVTGAGSGIGAAVAAALLHAGWRVALAGRRAERLHATARDAGAGEAFAVPADVTDPGPAHAAGPARAALRGCAAARGAAPAHAWSGSGHV